MYLIKCGCGCLFTISDEIFKKHHCFTCNNCSLEIERFSGNIKYSYNSENQVPPTFSIIPDNAKITVKFDI